MDGREFELGQAQRVLANHRLASMGVEPAIVVVHAGTLTLPLTSGQ